MFGLSRREAALILILLLIVTGFSAYKFVYQPKTVEMEQLKASIERTAVERLNAEMKLSDIPLLQNQIAKELMAAEEGAPLFFESIPQENLIVYLSETEDAAKFEINTYSFEALSTDVIPKISGVASELTSALKDVVDDYRLTYWVLEEDIEAAKRKEDDGALSSELFKTSARISFDNILYKDLLAYMKRIEDYPKEISVSSLRLSVSGEEAERELYGDKNNTPLSGSMTLDFYVIPKLYPHDSDADFLKWNNNAPKGKENPFNPPPERQEKAEADVMTEVNSQNTAVRTASLSDPDFFVIARAASTGLPTMTVGYAPDSEAETYVRSYMDGTIDVTVELSQQEGKYYYRLSAPSGIYPASGSAEFTPLNNDIRFIVYSNTRANENDLSKVNITVLNQTGLDFNWAITGDDRTRPRINMILK